MANALESASLVMIPSGYEDGTLGSLKPTDGSGDFTFSRGSNTSATRVNADGYIEKGYENLLLQSNTFSDAAWIGNSTIRTGNQAGYDGTNDAWLYEKLSTYSSLRQNISYNGVGTYSLYAKAGTLDWIRMSSSIGTISCWFDIQNGVVGTTGSSVVEARIESAGNGWYRCSMAFSGSISRIEILPVEGNSTFNPASGSVYIQDAMINQGLVAYPYKETTTAPVAGGILEDMPRLDYSNGSCPALLLEPQRTNALSHSEYITGSNFTIGDFILSPEGLNNGVGFIPSSSNTTHYISAAAGGLTIANSSVVFSFYVKEGTQPYLRGRFDESSFTKRCFFGIDLTDNSVLKSGTGASSVEITFEDSVDGWKKVIFTATYDATPTGTGLAIFLGSADSMGTDIDAYAGDGSTFFHIYGLQVEQGSYPTSYIPTYGVSQTRLKDVCLGAGDASTFNSAEGVLYAEIATLANDGTRSITLSDGGNNNSIYISYNTNGRLDVNLRSGGIYQVIFNYTGVTNPSEINKIAFKYKQNDFALWVNGVKVDTDSSGITPIALDRLNLSVTNAIADFFFGNINQVLYFPTALTDSECIELTTI